MELVFSNWKSGKGQSIKSGQNGGQLVAEVLTSGKTTIFESDYVEVLTKAAGVEPKTIKNSHSGKLNYWAKLDEEKLKVFIEALKNLEFIHTKGVSKKTPKAEAPKGPAPEVER